ncbi:MAG: hypothetical protein V4638_01425 [Bacteroidota bacterium]
MESDKNKHKNGELKNSSSLQKTTEDLLSSEEFVLKTQQQIAKDFAKFNLFFEDSFVLVAKSSAEEIVGNIENHLADILHSDATKMMQLLYTIDISEKEFKDLLGDPEFQKKLAEKILFREAYKVYLRSIF